MPRYTGQNKKTFNPRYFLSERTTPVKIDPARVPELVKAVALSDPKVPGDEGETASLMLRGATMDQVQYELMALAGSGEISQEQMQAALERMKKVEAEYGMLK